MHMRAAAGSLRHAHDLDAEAVVDEDEQLDIPGEQATPGVGAKAALAGQADWEPGQLHADARLAAGRRQLAAGSGRVTREGAQLVGVKARDGDHGAGQRGFQHGGDDLFLAVLGQ